MAYGTIKVDTVTFTDAGIDKSVTLSGLVQNPTFSGNVTVTGTLSGVTVTGTTANFTSGNFTNISGGTHTITSGVFAAGSATSPSITFTGDLNTGIYSPGADQVAISTGGSGKLFVDASGVIKISGTEIQQTTASNFIRINGSDGAGNGANIIVFGESHSIAPGRIALSAIGAGAIITSTAGAERLRITSAGLVGIGTSSPNLALHVSSGTAAGINNVAILKGGGSSSGNGAGLVLSPDSANTYNTWLGSRVATAFGGASWGCDLILSTNNNSAADNLTERLRITSAGLVGIGTSSPSYPLSVKTTTNGGQAIFDLDNDDAGNYGGLRVSLGNNDRECRLQATYGSSFFTFYTEDATGGPLERLRITSAGLVGVGTSSPGDVLHVKGGSTYAGVIADNSAATGGGAFRAYRNGVQKAIFCVDSWVTGTSSDDAAIYADAGGGIKFYTNNSSTAKAVLTSGGSLGIGTASPSAILDVKVASDAKLLVQDGNTTGNVKFNAVNNAVNANVNLEISANNTQFFNGGSERLRITSAGLVGVGTSSPAQSLDVKGIIQTTGANGWTTNGDTAWVYFGDSNNRVGGTRGGTIGFYSDYAPLELGAGAGVGSSSGTQLITFKTGTSERARIDSSGNVGIGTTSPGGTLDVGAVAGAVTAGDLTVTTGSTTAKVTIGRLSSTGNDSTSFRIRDRVDRDVLTVDAGNFVYSQAGTERARIDSSGRLGIGTSSPSSLVHIAGGGSGRNGALRFSDQGGTNFWEVGRDNAVNGSFTVTQNGTERLCIDYAAGNVGIGTTSPSSKLSIVTSANSPAFDITDASTSDFIITPGVSSGVCRVGPATGAMSLYTANIERARIDSSGRLLVGTSSSRNYTSLGTPQLQIEGIAYAQSSIGLTNNQNVTDGSYIAFNKTRGTSVGSNTIVQAGDSLGAIWFEGADGSAPALSSTISCVVEGTPAANTIASRLVFFTTADGASSPTERMRITNDGKIGIANNGVIQQGSGIGGGSAAGILELYNGGTGNTTLENTGAFPILFKTNGSERLRITSAGLVDAGSGNFVTSGYYICSSNGRLRLRNSSNNNYSEIYNPETGSGAGIAFTYGGGEAFRIDSSGRLLVGTSSARTVGEIVGGATFTHQPNFQLESPNSSLGLSLITNRSADTTGPFITLGKSRGNALGGVTVVQNGDELGNIYFAGADGTDIECIGAAIFAEVDGTPGTNDMPGRIVLSTTAAGASSPTERMRITSGGGLSVGSSVNPNALTQTTGIRLGDNTIASHSFTNITTSPVNIANGVGIGGLAFVQAYNTANGAQYTGIIMWRSGVVAVVSESNALGFGLTYTVSGSTLYLQTASGTISGSVITLAG